MTNLGGSIELPFPDKVLWPNGRTRSFMKRHRIFQAHKQWAWAAMKAILPPCFKPATAAKVQWSATFYPKTGNAIDDDNARASLKAYQDGMAKALGLDDKHFAAPTIHFAEPVKGGRVVIQIGEGQRANPNENCGTSLACPSSEGA